MLSPWFVGGNEWAAETVVMPVDRSAPVAMKPGAVGAKGDEVGKGKCIDTKLFHSIIYSAANDSIAIAPGSGHSTQDARLLAALLASLSPHECRASCD